MSATARRAPCAETGPLHPVSLARPVSGPPDVTSVTPSIPTPGTSAYWRAQREAVALFRAFRDLMDDPDPLLLLPVLRGIAAHGCARRMLAAHGHDIDRILASCEDHVASWGVPDPDDYDGMPEGAGHEAPPGDDRHRQVCPAEIGFTSNGMQVCMEFGVSDGLASVTVFVAPADEDAAPGMGVLHLAPPPEQARVIGRALLALAADAERGGDEP